MRKFIKHLYHSNTLGKRFIHPIKKLDDFISLRLLPEKIYIRRTFKNTFGHRINLNNPKTFNEKILWLLQNDRTPLHTLCADKFAVRNYIKEKIGEEYLIPLVLHTGNPKNIVPENMPDYPIIIKTNHGCGGHIIVKDKSEVNWKKVRSKLNKALKSNFYYKTREWQYKDIKPCILVEKLLLDQNSEVPHDYKFNCFNGKLSFAEVHFDRYIDYRKNCYDSQWNILNFNWGANRGREIIKPKALTKMILLAEVLAKDFRYVRVDLYNVLDKIYFGELSFSPGAGFCPFKPSKWDRKLGDKLII